MTRHAVVFFPSLGVALAAGFVLPSKTACAQSPETAPAATPRSAPSPIEQETARRFFREGVTLAQSGRWAEARALFERALAIRPAPIVRFNLAVACQNTNQLVRAIALYRDYLRETPREDDPVRVDAAARELESLARRVARIRVEVSGDAVRSLSLDGTPLNVALVGTDFPVDPGPHFVEVVGVAGDRHRVDGTLLEGDATVVRIALSPMPTRPTADWQPPTRTFGRQITRPGPDGRWIDWAARATAAPVSLWRQRPFAVALQLGYGAPVGVLALTFRYAPQPWFATELSAGLFGVYGPSAALSTHLRYPFERLALGVFMGLGVGWARVTTSCEADRSRPNNTCLSGSARSVSFYPLTLSTGLSAEFRVGHRFALRALAGMRFLTNPADARVMDDHSARPDCAQDAIDGDVCPIYRGDRDAVTVNPLFALDFGYTF